MFKKFSIFIFCLLFVFGFQGFSQAPCDYTPTENETDCGIFFDYIPGNVYMHTAPWINSNFWVVSNRITGLGQDLTNKYNFVTNWLVGLGDSLTNTIENVASISNHLDEVHAIVSNHEERIVGLGIALTNFEEEVEASTNDIRKIMQENYETLETNIKTNIEAVNSNLAIQGLALTNLTTSFWLFYTNVWDTFEATTNRMDELQGLIETNASITASNFASQGLAITNIQNNISTNFPQIHSNIESNAGNIYTNSLRIGVLETNVSTNFPQIHADIEAVSNYTKNVEGQVSTNYDYMTNAFLDVTNRLDENAGNIQSNFVYITNALQSATNRMDELQGLIETNAGIATTNFETLGLAITNIQNNIGTNVISDITQGIQANKENIEGLGTALTNNIGITVIGAKTADSEDETFEHISRMKFDKDSGFTVVTNENNEKEVEISLGSAWTVLVPDIPSVYTNEMDEVVTNAPLKPSGEEWLHIKVVETNESGTFWDYSNTNKNDKTFYIGINTNMAGGSFGDEIPYDSVFTTEDITVQGIPYPIGKYTNGTVIAEHTSVKEIFNNIFSKAVPPVYTNPTLAVTVNGFIKNETYEYGTQFSGKSLTATVTKWDSGDIEWYAYFTNNYMIVSNDTTLTVNVCNLDGFQSLGTLTFKTVVSHKEGPVKKDSYGNDYTNGMVVAGTLMDTFSIYGSRYMFWGVKSSQYPVDIASRDAIISLGSSNFVRKVSSLDIVLPKGTHQVIFAVPQFVHVSDVRFKNNFINESILDDFTTNLVENVYCMNLYSGDGDGGKTYKVYSYFSPQATAEDNTDHVIVGF